MEQRAMHESIAANYRAEYDRFKKLCDVVESRLRVALLDRGIQCTVSSRAKSVSGVQEKLDRPKFAERVEPGSDYRAALPDLAAVRVCTYRQSARAEVVDLAARLFRIQAGSVKVVDESRRDWSAPGRWYSATHLQVGLNESDLRLPDLENVRELWCELQVCSLVSHVWNEVEHDISYKSLLPLSARGQELLHQLGEWRADGDALIDRILLEAKRNETELRGRPITRFADFCNAVDLPNTYSFKPAPEPFWLEIHSALGDAGVETAAALWDALDLSIANCPDALMDVLNREPIKLLRVLGGRAALRVPSVILEPSNDSHRFLTSLLPKLAAELRLARAPRIKSIADGYAAAFSDSPGS